tara:strand:+ start:1510 stop:1809 length:300 start_codon:yes stop_codon:yes gene_type:complete
MKPIILAATIEKRRQKAREEIEELVYLAQNCPDPVQSGKYSESAERLKHRLRSGAVDRDEPYSKLKCNSCLRLIDPRFINDGECVNCSDNRQLAKEDKY